MKDLPLMGCHALTDKASNLHMINFAFEPNISLFDSKGKMITLKIGLHATASEVADYLMKAGHMIYEELKKG